MDFEADHDQRQLEQAVQRLVERDLRFERRRAHAGEPEGFSRAVWSKFAEIGLLGLNYDVEDGGLGGSAVDVMIVMRALGRALPLEPLLPAMVLGAAALRDAEPALRRRWAGAVAAGDRVLAWVETPLRARPQGEGWQLDGRAASVLHGDAADALLVPARIDFGSAALFLVDARSAGLVRTGWPTHDGRRAADIVFDAVQVAADARIGDGAAIERVRHAGIAALAAEAVGAMELALDLTVTHLKTRVQFGAPLASQQALRHRAAEMLIALEQARSMAMYAALMQGDADAVERAKAMSAVKLQIGTAARFVAQQAVQLHGGLGVTDECAVGHVLKRVTVMDGEFGSGDEHLVALARAGGFAGASA